MATPSQIHANRENARLSTGPRTEEGRARSSQNALRFGLFSAKNCVRPEEVDEYLAVSGELWNELRPHGALQEMFAVEVIRSAWRLHRCVEVEAALAEQSAADPMLDDKLFRTQQAVDRARSQAHGIQRRALAELRRLQAAVPAQNEPVAPRPKTPAPAKPSHSDTPADPQIPRSAACPCGSGQKYKRCCGRTAPAMLQNAA